MAIATATSSSSASAFSSMAAIAEAPQIAKPVAISRLRGPPNPIRLPSQLVASSVVNSVTTTRPITGAPSETIESRDSERPSRTTPIRSSFLVAILRPGRAAVGTSPRLAATAPRSTAQVRMPI